MNFKLIIPQPGGDLVWRTTAVSVEDGIEQFEIAVLAGEIAKPDKLEEYGYGAIEIGWATEMGRWD